MSKWIVQKPSILDPKQISHGFVINDGEYAAVPMSNSDTQLMVIHNGSPLKVCRNESSGSQLYQETPKTKKMRQTFRFFSSIIIGSVALALVSLSSLINNATNRILLVGELLVMLKFLLVFVNPPSWEKTMSSTLFKRSATNDRH